MPTLSDDLWAKINELDTNNASDIAYRGIFSTGTKKRCRKGETWRSRAITWATNELRKELTEV